MAKHDDLQFRTDRPFFSMVGSFLIATVGMGPVYDPERPLLLEHISTSYHGQVESTYEIDLEEVRHITQQISAATAVQELCCMLMISTHAVALELLQSHPVILQSPVFEFFRHVRNAAAHRNRFNFVHREPRRAATWCTLSLERHVHQGTACFGSLLDTADALALVHDVEKLLPPADRQST
jgi:hypothetical protein